MAAPPLPYRAQPSRTVEPRARARAARRQALLETAEAVFAERGFTGATMAEIASRAGYSAGNLYNVFKGKDALFAEVLSIRADQVLEQVREALRTAESLGETIDLYVDATLKLVEQHRGFFVMLMLTTPDFDFYGANRNPGGLDLREELEQQLEQMFQQAILRGDIPSGDPRAYACMLHGTMTARISRWVRNDESHDELWASATDLKRLLRRGLGIA
ncbi:MAG: TetR/AcrR family transcriptional regulator [Myxococcota bacterium]|nr:TetR/AcrR family transcriptional regulator [Myxococcota bacterium]